MIAPRAGKTDKRRHLPPPVLGLLAVAVFTVRGRPNAFATEKSIRKCYKIEKYYNLNVNIAFVEDLLTQFDDE
jgi:hypothetical protein